MNRPFPFSHRLSGYLIGLAALCGCASPQFTTLTIYETPQSFVRLEVDRTLAPGTGHNHPFTISPEQMAAILRGVVIEEPVTRLPFYDNFSQPSRHAAFTDKEVSLFAPLLALAISKATPDEIVTFYETQSLSGSFSGGSREVTSGGLFIRGDELHLILANYRSSTQYLADIGVAETQDDRLVPLRAIAPQRGRLDFEPRSAKREETDTPLDKLVRPDRREVILLHKLLQPSPAASTPAP